MEPGLASMKLDVALFLLVFGLPGAIWPYRIARFGEQIDAIGSTREESEVEPADWNVMLTRIAGVGMVAGAVVLLFEVAWIALI